MSDPRSLWNQTPTRQAILDFVAAVATPNGPGKPVNIELHIGRKPILAGGNADGDIHMLWYSQTGPYRSLQLLLRHDDGEREYAYDAGAEKAQQLAAVRNWQVISMQQDFLQVFRLE